MFDAPRADAQVAARQDHSGSTKAVAEPPEAYLRAARLATQEYELGNYVEARAHFLKADAVFSNARSLRALGAVEFDLKNYAASIDYLSRALQSTVRPLDGSVRAQTAELLARARAYVGKYRLHLAPETATLEVDGVQVELPPDHGLLLQVGPHALQAQATGYYALRKSLEVRSGEDSVLDLKLVPLPAPAAEARPLHKRWWLWTTVGVAVVGGLTAGLVLGLRDKRAADADGGSTHDTIVVR